MLVFTSGHCLRHSRCAIHREQMEGEEGPIQGRALFDNKSGKEPAKRRIEENIPRKILAKGSTMAPASPVRLRLLVTMCWVVSVPGINSFPGKETGSLICLAVGSHSATLHSAIV